MNYYIQGNKEKADQIKAAFEAKGCVMRTGMQCDLSDMIYFSLNGKVGGIKLRNLDLFKTHPDYKELGLPVEPKFKVGDEIIWNEPKGSSHTEPVKVIQLIDKDQLYMVDMSNGVGYVAYDMQDYYELIPKPHYDIKNFKPFDKVLVKYYNDEKWKCGLFSHLSTNSGAKFVCVGSTYVQCIPFEGNEHLLGTTDMCDKQYINW